MSSGSEMEDASTSSSSSSPPNTLQQMSAEARLSTGGKHQSVAMKRQAVYRMRAGERPVNIARKFKIGRATLYRWMQQWKRDGTLQVTKPTGRKPRLGPRQQARLLDYVRKNPTATNKQAVRGGRVDAWIAARTVSHYLKRAHFTRKHVTDESPSIFDERVLHEYRDYYRALQNVPPEQRCYMDESFVYDNEAPTMGRSLRGVRIPRNRERPRTM